MRVLIDECLPRQVKDFLPGHEVYTVQGRGWAGVKNGELLLLAAEEFQVFVTCDKNLRYQQNLKQRQIAIIELPTNNLRLLREYAEALREALLAASPSDYIFISTEEN